MSAYEKIFLGWSNYEFVDWAAKPKKKTKVKLGVAEFNTKKPQALIVGLPDKEVTSFIGDPFSGSFYYFSGSGNDLDNSMTRDVTLPAGSVTLTAMVNFDIEVDWDYAYLTVNGDPVATNFSTNDNPNGQNFGEGIYRRFRWLGTVDCGSFRLCWSDCRDRFPLLDRCCGC